MRTEVMDSDRRCPRDGKRLIVEIGQDDTSCGEGWTRMVHYCLHCTYSEIDENWPRPKLTKPSKRTAAERVYALRMGEWVPVDDA